MKTLKTAITLIAFTFLTLVGCKNDTKKNEQEHVNTEAKKENDHGHEHGANGEHVEAQENETTITVKANSALEYKFKINEGEKITYKWSATAPLVFDFHGDPAEKDKYPEGFFKSYSKGTKDGEEGEQAVPFKGSHGWYWKNTTDQDIKVTLETKGNYIVIGKIQ